MAVVHRKTQYADAVKQYLCGLGRARLQVFGLRATLKSRRGVAACLEHPGRGCPLHSTTLWSCAIHRIILSVSLLLAACSDASFTDELLVEHDASPAEAHTASSATGSTVQSDEASRPSGPIPDIHVTGSYSASDGTGSITVFQSGPGAQSSEDSATPTAVSWTRTTIDVTYAGATNTYDLTKDEQELFDDLLEEVASAEDAAAPQGHGSTFRMLLSKEDVTPEEAHDFLVSQGYTVDHLDADRLEFRGPLVPPLARLGTVTHEIRHVFNVRTKEFERSDLYRDGVRVYAHGPTGPWTGMRRAP